MKEISHSPIFSSDKISLLANPRTRTLPQFVKNEGVEGKVLKAFSDEKALIFVKGSVVVARTPYPLKEGSALSLKVADLSPSTTLKLLVPPIKNSKPVNTAVISSAIKENLWKTTLENIGKVGIENGIQSLLKELLTDLSWRSFLKPTPELLKLLIQKSGVVL